MHISRSLRCAHFAHGSCIFTDKWESRFFLKCHQRLVCFCVKRINFSFRSVIKNKRAGTVWTVYCASATDYQRKKISDNSQKKAEFACSWHTCSISGFTFWANCQLLFIFFVFRFMRWYLDTFSWICIKNLPLTLSEIMKLTTTVSVSNYKDT